MVWKTTDHTGKPTVWYSKKFIEEIKQFCRDQIKYFNHDVEYQHNWKVLLERIEKEENGDYKEPTAQSTVKTYSDFGEWLDHERKLLQEFKEKIFGKDNEQQTKEENNGIK